MLFHNHPLFPHAFVKNFIDAGYTIFVVKGDLSPCDDAFALELATVLSARMTTHTTVKGLTSPWQRKSLKGEHLYVHVHVHVPGVIIIIMGSIYRRSGKIIFIVSASHES